MPVSVSSHGSRDAGGMWLLMLSQPPHPRTHQSASKLDQSQICRYPCQEMAQWDGLWGHSLHPQQTHSQHIDGLAQDCCNSSALAMELLQSYSKPSIDMLRNTVELLQPCTKPLIYAVTKNASALCFWWQNMLMAWCKTAVTPAHYYQWSYCNFVQPISICFSAILNMKQFY